MGLFSFFHRDKREIGLTYPLPGRFDTPIMGEAVFSLDLFQDNSNYSEELAKLSFGLAVNSFSLGQSESTSGPKNAYSFFGKMGFKDIKANEDYYHLPDIDSLGIVFAHRKIKIKRKKAQLLAIGIRGANYGAEWASNMALGPNGNHEGIDQATDKLVEDLRLYINTHKIKGEIAIWVAGFSRAAGVCNLFAGRLCDDLPLPRQVRFDKKRLFAYSFASPNVTDLPIKDEGIHNVIFENDLIPRIPFPTFGLSRHGEDHIIRADPGELASLLSSLGLDDIPSFKMMKLDLAHILDAKKRFKIDVDNPLGQGEFVSIFFDAISTLFTREDYFYGLEGGLVRLGSLVDSSLPNPYGKLGAFMSAFFSTLLEEKGKQIFFNAFGLNIDWSSYIPDIAERAGEEVGLEENDISEISASMTFLFRKMSPRLKELLPYLPTIANKGNGRSLVFAHEVVVYYALINRD